MTTQDTRDNNVGQGQKPVTAVVVISVLLIAVLFNLVLLYPQLTGGTVAINDLVMHLLLTDMAVDALKNGRDITDPWQGTMNMGLPFFRYYHHLNPRNVRNFDDYHPDHLRQL